MEIIKLEIKVSSYKVETSSSTVETFWQKEKVYSSKSGNFGLKRIFAYEKWF